jgi:hypothetical protein
MGGTYEQANVERISSKRVRLSFTGCILFMGSAPLACFYIITTLKLTWFELCSFMFVEAVKKKKDLIFPIFFQT